MDILGELRAKAEQEQQRLGEEQARQERLEQKYKQQIRPALLSIMKYLDELVSHITFVGQDIPHRFDVPGYGLLTNLEMRDHAVNADSRATIAKVRYSYRCVSRAPVTFRVSSKEDGVTCRDWLGSLQQKYIDWPLRNARDDIIGMNFEVEFAIPVSVQFRADRENGRILVAYTNFNGIGTERFPVSPERVDQDWLNELGAFLLKRNEDLVKLPVEEDHRSRIQSLVKQEAMARDLELLEAERRERDEKERRRADSLLGKLKSRIVPGAKKT